MNTKVLTSVLFLSFGILILRSDSGESRKRSEPVYEDRTTKPEIEDPLFRDEETSVDLFGSYAATGGGSGSRFKDGFGGGIGVNQIFLKYAGLGLDAYA